MGWRVPEVEREAHYGGNNIPDSYLDKFNARTAEFMRRVGAKPITEALPDNIPAALSGFLEQL